MRKIGLIITLILSFYIVSGCSGIKTPEELIEPPGIDPEKRMMISTVTSFIPTNSEILNIFGSSKNNNSESIVSVNLDNSMDDNEIVSIFRDRTTRKLGLLIIKNTNSTWSKIFETRIDSTDISDYSVVDLNNDGKSEIILGYFSDKGKQLFILANENSFYKKIFETKYLALNVNKIENRRLLAISVDGFFGFNNNLVILEYDGSKINKISEKRYSDNVEIYKIEYGSVNSKQKGYFVDMYINGQTGDTDVLELSESKLISLINDDKKILLQKELPTVSADINGDGIIDISGNERLYREGNKVRLVFSNFFYIDNDKNLKVIKSVYDDFDLNINVELKGIDLDYLDAIKIDYESLIFRFIYIGKEVEFLNIKRVPINQVQNYEGYNIVLEKEDIAIIAKLDYLENIESNYKYEFDKTYKAFRNLTDIIKFIE